MSTNGLGSSRGADGTVLRRRGEPRRGRVPEGEAPGPGELLVDLADEVVAQQQRADGRGEHEAERGEQQHHDDEPGTQGAAAARTRDPRLVMAPPTGSRSV